MPWKVVVARNASDSSSACATGFAFAVKPSPQVFTPLDSPADAASALPGEAYVMSVLYVKALPFGT
ncbi:hypothetical protein [Streptomyces sp. NPDC093598]|uniref:hypothetical protein n=1 Tax=Streptomyces sp. NPDC093598 TaxID=3366046 RepID=UPI0038191695